MAEPQRDLEKLRAEQEKEDADLLDVLEKESKAFDKVGRQPFPKMSPQVSLPTIGLRNRTHPRRIPRECL